MTERIQAEIRILALGMATALLYALSYFLQQSLFYHGASRVVLAAAAREGASPVVLASLVSLYAAVTVGLFVTYRAVLSMCGAGHLAQRRVLRWALMIPCLISISMIFSRPWFSQDIFSYMAHGFIGIIPGGNPLLAPAAAAANTSIGPSLAAYGWHGAVGVSPYGIVWTRIEMAVMACSGGDLSLALRLFKVIVVLASLGTAYSIWVYLGVARPGIQTFGTLAYLWNPLILGEFAGEGHNDAVMLLFVLAAMAACAKQWNVSSLIAQLLGFLSKYVSVMFWPAQFIYLWRNRRSAAALGVELSIALSIIVGLAALLYAPLWAGSHTLDGLLQRGEPMSSATPFGAINWLLRRSPLSQHAATLTVVSVTAPLLALIAWVSFRVTDVTSVARAIAWISLGYVLLAAPDYWPWYACLPVALIIIGETERLLWLAIFMSLMARLCAPLDLLRDHGFIGSVFAKGLTTGLGASLPLLLLMIWWYRRIVRQ